VKPKSPIRKTRSPKSKAPSSSLEKALGPIRQEIDSIDQQVLDLFLRRLDLVREVGRIKRSRTRGVWVPSREKDILSRLLEHNRGKFPERALAEIFRTIFSVSRKEEDPETIAFYGSVGSMSHAAATEQFGSSSNYTASSTLEDVFAVVSSGHADFGVVPLQISREGLVTHSFEIFLRSDLKICAEYFMRLALVFAAKGRRRSYKVVYLQPQVLEYAHAWLRHEYPTGIEVRLASSSREAAERASGDPAAACLCHPFAAQIYGLNVLVDSVPYGVPQDLRFLTAGRSQSSATRFDKTTIAFALTDRMGALEKALQSFRKHRINIAFLESYPASRSSPTVTFFADVSGHQDQQSIGRAVEDLSKVCAFVKILGSYPEFRI